MLWPVPTSLEEIIHMNVNGTSRKKEMNRQNTSVSAFEYVHFALYILFPPSKVDLKYVPRSTTKGPSSFFLVWFAEYEILRTFFPSAQFNIVSNETWSMVLKT